MAATSEIRLDERPGGIRVLGLLLVVVLAVLAVVGVVAYARQVSAGMGITGLRSLGTAGGASWGLYIVLMVYFVGVGFTSLAIVALLHLHRIDVLRPITRVAEIVATASFAVAGLGILVDIGQPLRGIVNSFKYARPGSPFFGTFTLAIFGGLMASLTYLYLDGRRVAAVHAAQPGRLRGLHKLLASGYGDTPAERERHARAGFWLAIAVLPLLIVALSTEGFVFGLQAARPGWYGALQAPAFVVLAASTGVGGLIAVAAILRLIHGREEWVPDEVFRFLRNVLAALLFVYLYFLGSELLTHGYAAAEDDIRMTQAFLTGEYAWLYWTSVALLLVPLVLLLGQIFLRRFSLSLIVLSGFLVAVAGVGRRYVIVVPSQTHGSMLPYGPGSYTPTLNELAVALGLLAVGGLVYAFLARLFPPVEVGRGERAEVAGESAERWGARTFTAIAMVVAGFAVQAVSYLFFAAPIGEPTGVEFADPRLPFAPALFMLGVLLVFAAVVVYEVTPDRRRGSRGAEG